MKENRIMILLLLFAPLLHSCGKDFLEEKADKSQQIPKSIADFQALMDNDESMNSSSAQSLGIIASDEYYITDARYQTFPVQQSGGVNISYQKRAYTWEKNIYDGNESTDWATAYGHILWTNVVLDGLSKQQPNAGQTQSWNLVKGCALFHRALNYYNLAQLYCKVYREESAATDLGMPLRKEADVTTKIPRSNLFDTYQFILEDLKDAADLLPDASTTVYRPFKASAYALLARIYLQMGDYQNAWVYVNQCLDMRKELVDYNMIDATLRYPFPIFGNGNPEVLFMSTATNNFITSASLFNAAPDLLSGYSANDLRKEAYYFLNKGGNIIFKGSYNGNVLFFTGLATDEMYLVRAECLTRAGRLNEALADLNQLAMHRYKKDSFVPFALSDQQSLLTTIFEERKKELVMRGTRWEDLRRLNKESQYAKTLVREIAGHHFELRPNEARYVWPLPPEAIDLGSYEQNPR